MIRTFPLLTEVLDLLPDTVCIVDIDGTLLFVNASFERIFGYASEGVLGRKIFDFIHDDDREATLQHAKQVMAGRAQRYFRNRYVHKLGHVVDIQWSANWLPEQGVRIGVGREVTELRRAERELEHLANHDSLTGLANRHRLHGELQHAIVDSERTGKGLALLYVDLDGFKVSNDRWGHEAGDYLLREVAQRLQQGLRQGDLVARVGGDEFVVMLPGCRDIASAQALADGIHTRLRPAFMLPEGSLVLGASIGIAHYPDDGNDPHTLLKRADHAMYEAKRKI